MNYSTSKQLFAGRCQWWRPLFAESAYHRWIVPLPCSYLLAASRDDGHCFLKALTIGELFHFHAAICWPLAEKRPVLLRALTIGELFHFQAAICWPLAVMTATVCWSMKSTYHRKVIPIPSRYLLAMTLMTATVWWCIRSSYHRSIISFTICPMACRSIEEHLPWKNYSTSKQQFAGRWQWWRPLFAGPWEGSGRHSRPKQCGPCQPSFETRHNTAPPIHKK